MRTLNRPMFNMGGPIKEGVMHGIREPYKGGQLVRPGPGRPGYQGLNPRKNILKKGAAWGASKIPGMTKGWAQRLWNKYKFPPRMQATTPTGPGITHATKARDFMHRAGQYFTKHPYLSTLGPAYLGTTDPAAGIAKGVAGAIPPTTQFITEALTPGRFEKYLPPDDWWKWKSDVEWKPGDIRGEDKKVKVPPVAGVKDYGPPGGTQLPSYTDPDKANKLAQAAKDRRVNELLEIMGHKQSKKDAVYDALIDASQIVTGTPGGETLDITKDIISPVIAATSKRFDKPKEIEEAVRLMQTKADIEAKMPSTKLKDLIAVGIDTPAKQEAYERTLLGQPTSFGMAKVAAGKNLTGDNAIDAAAAAYTPDTYQGRLLSSKDFKDEKEKYKNKKDSDIITAFTEEVVKEKDYPDGDYVVGTTLVTVTEGKVSNIRR